MTTPSAPLTNLRLVEPDPATHAPITLRWFEADYGHDTLRLMGNAEHELGTPSLENELSILQGFVDLRDRHEQLTWMLEFDGDIVGVAWIELTAQHGVQPPSVHLMIGDKKYRGKGIGKATLLALIHYIKATLPATTVYSRHLKSNHVIAHLNRRLGFVDDGSAYIDANGLEWQNVKLMISV